MNKKIWLFGGTTEGRMLGEWLANTTVEVTVSVATEYGEHMVEPKIQIQKGRLDCQEMAVQMAREKYCCVIDATHPYAVAVTENIKMACKETKTPYYRVLRESYATAEGVWVASVEEAVAFLESTDGHILVTTGSKELEKFTKLSNFAERVYARVLPTADVITQCQSYGIEGKHLICMQGPFAKEMNIAQMKHCNAKYLVTKESGKAGGFLEKIEAAKAVGATAVIIGRKQQEEGYSLEEIYEILQNQLSSQRTVTLLGMGMGKNTLTQEAKEAIQQADCIIGAKRMLEEVAPRGMPSFCSYDSEKIAAYIQQNRNYRRIVIVFSGDIGFYSGAKKMTVLLCKQKDIVVKGICGISALPYFAARLQVPWEEAIFVSLHGTTKCILGYLWQGKPIFLLLGKKTDAGEICSSLVEQGFGEMEVAIGENLSMEQEAIYKGQAKVWTTLETSTLAVMAIFPKTGQKQQALGMSDDDFLRGKVPMTKREIRTIAISYLAVEKEDIVWDVGAGTGSVSIELGFRCPFGKVYAIEQKPEALALLEQNKKKWEAVSMKIVAGTAPDVLEELPPPDKVFLGGTSGNLQEIVALCLKKNAGVTLVATAVTMETIAEVERVFTKYAICWEATQIAVAKTEKVGQYHMMKGQNPVTIFVGKGRGQ